MTCDHLRPLLDSNPARCSPGARSHTTSCSWSSRGVFHTIFQGQAVSREIPSRHTDSASASNQHWKRFNGGCVRMKFFWRVWCYSRTRHRMHTIRRNKSCGHTPRESMARPTCGTGWVACRRGVMSCNGEQCCTIRQHTSGGSNLPTQNQGIKVLGCLLGHADFVTAQLETIPMKHEVLLQAIPNVRDVQSGWLLLQQCAAVRANFNICALSDRGLGGSVCQNTRCQFVAVHEHERVGWVLRPQPENQNIMSRVPRGQNGNMTLPVVWKNATIAQRALPQIPEQEFFFRRFLHLV